ncbi:hypothetical protein [Moorena sp. SIO4G3]|uniref:hypothetical protein n=1 Tax=Moorena sp. SIO4G3 TaxID=2607821 RepID=UPI00142A9F3E|nr:hypothetical protein [Moorena sp. SIO4G3]NEO76167.1 hypothetical protein [Moorena sp. SIO4G3]
MKKFKTGFKRIEQDLQELGSRFSNVDLVGIDLDEIQSQLESIAETEKKLKESLAEVSQLKLESKEIIKEITEAHKKFEQRFTEPIKSHEREQENLEYFKSESKEIIKGITQSQKSFEQRFTELTNSHEREQQNFEQRFTELRDNNHLQVETLKLELLKAETRLNVYGYQIEKFQDYMTSIETNFADIRNDFRSLPNQIQTLVDPGVVQSQQKTIKKLNKQIRMIWSTMIGILILCLFIAAWAGFK